jgi:cold shock CspA family protein
MRLKRFYSRYQSQSTVLGAKPHLPPSLSPPSPTPILAFGTKESTMKNFGTLNSFDNDQGHGSIKPEAGGDNLNFERSAFSWDIKAAPPTAGQRLSYDVGTNKDKPCALNLRTV